MNQFPMTYDRRRPADRLFSPGTISAEDVERELAWRYQIIPQSLRFMKVVADVEPAVAAFVADTPNGGTVMGTIRVETRVEQDRVVFRTKVNITSEPWSG